ncbi:hypothetical protein CE91St63_15450 [[Clostridium] hylemonae]|nr:hypothetical protein CE91St63_15450 [[Clostridium] hylemonae]
MQGCGSALRQAGNRNGKKSRKQTTEPIRNEILKGFPPSEALGNVICDNIPVSVSGSFFRNVFLTCLRTRFHTPAHPTDLPAHRSG